MSKDYGSWSLAAIKAELRKRNAKITGKKAILVQRLHEYDKIFGPIINDPENSYKINIPAPQYFIDVTSDTNLPALDEEDLNVYCLLAERSDFTTGKKMYEDGFLLTARAATRELESYVVATCASEMRKQISYTVSLKYEAHTILETQCECAAGMGPYAQCKHIIMVLYALIHFTRNKDIRTRPSTTSSLQNFHQPNKFYKGDPVEAENLKLKSKNEVLQTITNFDPRASCSLSKEKYEEQFKSSTMNFCAQKKVTMPLAQLIKPANKKALFRDHDYMETTFEEVYIESLQMDTNEIKLLEMQTRNNKKYWEEQRLLRLQSSKFHKICTCIDKKKLAKTLLKKTDIQTAATKHGNKYERVAVKRFAEKTELKTEKCGIIVHPTSQFIASTPDRLIGEDAVLEIKCPYSAREKYISSESVPYIELCEKTGHFKLIKKHEYYYQVQGQLLCTGRKKAYFCIYTITDMCILEIERDEDFINMMYDKLVNFYNEFFKEQYLNRYLYNIKI